jgi:hypothetical protein
MTPQEREEIILEAIERAYLGIPELVGNLMAQHASLNKINTKFYADHPEFRKHRDAVMSVVEMVEGKNPLMKYEDILKKSVPKIRERINTLKNMDMDNVSTNPNRQFEEIKSPKIDPHGII